MEPWVKNSVLELNYLHAGLFSGKLYPIPDQNCLISVPYPRLSIVLSIRFEVGGYIGKSTSQSNMRSRGEFLSGEFLKVKYVCI